MPPVKFPRVGVWVLHQGRVGIVNQHPLIKRISVGVPDPDNGPDATMNSMVEESHPELALVHIVDEKGETVEELRDGVPVEELVQAKLADIPEPRRPAPEALHPSLGYHTEEDLAAYDAAQAKKAPEA